MGAWRNYTETKQACYNPVPGPKIKHRRSSVKNKAPEGSSCSYRTIEKDPLRRKMSSGTGAAPRGRRGVNRPSTPHKGHFCKSSKTDEKIFGVWGVTSPTILEFQPEFFTSGFQRPELTYILPNC